MRGSSRGRPHRRPTGPETEVEEDEGGSFTSPYVKNINQGRSVELDPGEEQEAARVEFVDDKFAQPIGITIQCELINQPQQNKIGGPVTAVIRWGTSGYQFVAEIDVGIGTQFAIYGSFCRVSLRNDCNLNPADPLTQFRVIGAASIALGTVVPVPKHTKTTYAADAGTGINAFGLIDNLIAPGGLISLRREVAGSGAPLFGVLQPFPTFAKELVIESVRGAAGGGPAAMRVDLLARVNPATTSASYLFAAGEKWLIPVEIPGSTAGIDIINIDTVPIRVTPVFKLSI